MVDGGGVGITWGVVVAVADWDTDYRHAGNEGIEGQMWKP